MLAAVLLAGAGSVASLAAAADTAAAAGSESLGAQLLDDLDPNLFSLPDAIPEAAPARPDFQKRILPGLADELLGEDIGGSSPGRTLAWVERNMKTAAVLLPQQKSLRRAGEVQETIVADLDKLIDELAQQCRGGACQSSGKSDSPNQRSQAGKKSGQPKAGKGTAAARDSMSRLGRGDPSAVSLAEREEMMKNLWGHLPPHAREQMLQSYSVEFLPEYELEIEKYFRRLAEQPDDGRRPN